MNTSQESNSWRPCATPRELRVRATLLAAIRSYFFSQRVLEVVTPAMSRGATTDPNIESFRVLPASPSGQADTASHFLHTSPEFAMKRLLCAGAGDIYQVCSVFRSGEAGVSHNPEFQMLEWYRLGMTTLQLMGDIEGLLADCISALQVEFPEYSFDHTGFFRIRYYDLLHELTGFSRNSLSTDAIRQFLQERGIDCPLDGSESLDTWLDFLMSLVVMPQLPSRRFTFVYDYPATQASLANIYESADGPVADRFELFFGQTELANGFFELTDGIEQEQRFISDINIRKRQNQASVPYDRHLIEALKSGLPECSGVAIGVDRLHQVFSGRSSLVDVLNFPVGRA